MTIKSTYLMPFCAISALISIPSQYTYQKYVRQVWTATKITETQEA